MREAQDMPVLNGRNTGEKKEERTSLELHWPHEERGKHLGLIQPWTLSTLYNNIELMSEEVLEPVKAKKL